MSTLTKATVNMYKWVTHMWNALSGCSHQCTYCYQKAALHRWGKTFSATPSINRPFPNLGGPVKTVFVCHTSDLFAADVPVDYIEEIIGHCMRHDNTYVFQTKNPARLVEELAGMPMPRHSIIGTTIETDDEALTAMHSITPSPYDRAAAIAELSKRHSTFVTVEPIMSFGPESFSKLLLSTNADYIHIGADSKGSKLPEPTAEAVRRLVASLLVNRKQIGMNAFQPEIIPKSNLRRIDSATADMLTRLNRMTGTDSDPHVCKFCGRTFNVTDNTCAVCSAKMGRGATLTVRYRKTR